MTDAGGSGSAPAGSTSEQLRATLGNVPKPDLKEMCKAAGITGYSKKRKEDLIDLLVLKKSRPDEQVAHWIPPICAVCALRSMSFCLLHCCLANLSKSLLSGFEPFFCYPDMALDEPSTRVCECDAPHRTLGQTMRTPLTRTTALGKAGRLSLRNPRSGRTSSQCGKYWPKRTGSPVRRSPSCRSRVNPSKDLATRQSTSRSKTRAGSCSSRFSRT